MPLGCCAFAPAEAALARPGGDPGAGRARECPGEQNAGPGLRRYHPVSRFAVFCSLNMPVVLSWLRLAALWGRGLLCAPALRTPWTLEPPGSLWVTPRFRPRERARMGAGACAPSLSSTAAALCTCFLPGRGRRACVRDARSEGTRCQRAAWPSATSSGGRAAGAAPPGSQLARVFRSHGQFPLTSPGPAGFTAPDHLPPGRRQSTEAPWALWGRLAPARLSVQCHHCRFGGTACPFSQHPRRNRRCRPAPAALLPQDRKSVV